MSCVIGDDKSKEIPFCGEKEFLTAIKNCIENFEVQQESDRSIVMQATKRGLTVAQWLVQCKSLEELTD